MDMGEIRHHLGKKTQTGPDLSKRPLDYKLSAHTEYSDRVVGLSFSSRETITY